MKKYLISLGLLFAVLLSGCTESHVNSKEPATTSKNLHLLEKDFEEITPEEWESVYFSKEDYDHFLSSLPEENDNGTQDISEVTMKSSKITLVLNNKDGETLNNLVSAPFIDAKVRQTYLRSGYFNGQQPAILITDQSGTVLSDTSEPLDFVKP